MRPCHSVDAQNRPDSTLEVSQGFWFYRPKAGRASWLISQGAEPFPGVRYSAPGPPDLQPVTIALDDPMRVSRNP